MKKGVQSTFIIGDNALVRKDLISHARIEKVDNDGTNVSIYGQGGTHLLNMRCRKWKDFTDQLAGLDELNSENERLRKEVRDLKAHILARPGGFEYFEAQARFEEQAASEEKNQ